MGRHKKQPPNPMENPEPTTPTPTVATTPELGSFGIDPRSPLTDESAEAAKRLCDVPDTALDVDGEPIKRKRGRPRKTEQAGEDAAKQAEYAKLTGYLAASITGSLDATLQALDPRLAQEPIDVSKLSFGLSDAERASFDGALQTALANTPGLLHLDKGGAWIVVAIIAGQIAVSRYMLYRAVSKNGKAKPDATGNKIFAARAKSES